MSDHANAMEPSDTELMLQLAGGDDLALNALMDRWARRVTSFLYQMTGQQDVAGDLAQETFVRLYGARKRYKPQGNFSTYLFAIAANLARNHARWRSRHPTVSLDAASESGENFLENAADPTQSPAEVAESSERFRAVHDALLGLPHDLKEALVLFVYEGMSHAEIAEVKGCSQKAIETRIYRARQQLKAVLS